MKIVMLTCSAFPFHNSGVAHVVDNTAKELIKKGHQVFVLAIGLDPDENFIDLDYNGYKVRGITLEGATHNFNNTLKESDYNNPETEKILEQYLDEIKPDIVHFHSLQGLGANTVKKAKQMGYKTVVTMHDWWWLCPFSFMADCNHKPCNQLVIDTKVCKTCIQCAKPPYEEDFVTKRETYLKQILDADTDLILPVSDYVKGYLEPNGITNTKIVSLPNGVEFYNELIRQRKKSDKIRFGFLGGKHELKGYDLLISACKELNHTNYEVHVYGCLQWDKGLIQKVMSYLRRGNIKELYSKTKRHLRKDNQPGIPITYHPLFEPDQKDSAYEGIDILLSLSKVKESSSLVVREALIRGIPVITTPSGGPEEVIVNNQNGIILKETSSTCLKNAMEEVLTTDSLDRWAEYIRDNPYEYTYEDQVKRLIELYENL